MEFVTVSHEVGRIGELIERDYVFGIENQILPEELLDTFKKDNYIILRFHFNKNYCCVHT